jgi:O-antigen/teichoic acid export membrane protein
MSDLQGAWRHPVTRGRALLSSPLGRNAIFLLVGQVMVMLSGFTFWAIASRLSEASAVGIAGSLILASALVATVSVVGANQGLVRFLPSTSSPSRMLATAVSIVTVATIIVASVTFSFLSNNSDLGHSRILLAALFVLNSLALAVGMVADAAMLAHNRVGWNSLAYVIASLTCLGLISVVGQFGAVGVLAVNALLYGIVASVSLVLLSREKRFTWRPTFDASIARELASFAGASYLAGILWMTPVLILPSIALPVIGATSTGYLMITMTLFNVLLLISVASTQSLFASLSADANDPKRRTRSVLTFTLVLVLAGSLFLAAAGFAILSFFGDDYAVWGYPLLLWLIPSAFLATINLVGNVHLKHRSRLRRLVIFNAVRLGVTLGFWIAFLPSLGLSAVPAGFLLGHGVLCCAHLIFLTADHRAATRSERTPRQTENRSNAVRWIVVTGVAIATLVVLTVWSSAIRDEVVSLGIWTQPQPLTEMYFANHSVLPNTYRSGEPLTFTVVLHSQEKAAETYTYRVFFINEAGLKGDVLNSGSVTLSPGQQESLSIAIMPPETATREKVSIVATRVTSTLEASGPNAKSDSLTLNFWTAPRL